MNSAWVLPPSLILATPRLDLRGFTLEDLADFNAYASVPGVGEWAGWKHHESLRESAAVLTTFIKERKTFALVDKSSQKVIGSLGIEFYHCALPARYEPLQGRELGYVLAREMWGQGLMSEAVRRVIDYFFNEVHLDFLTVSHFKRNQRSCRVILKAGFHKMGEDFYATQDGRIEEDIYYVLDNPALTSPSL